MSTLFNLLCELPIKNWLREPDSNRRKMLMRHLSEPLDYPAIEN